MNDLPGITENISISLITAYQRWISPHKGFCCAHSAYHGGASCSAWAKKVIKKHGLALLFPLMCRRFKACAAAYEKIKKEKESENIEGIKSCPCMNKETVNCCVASWPF